jgi:hypothetical protein
MGGYVADLSNEKEVRGWENLDLFDTLNESALGYLRVSPPTYSATYERERNEVLVTALLTLNAQNRHLQDRLDELSKKM